MRRTTIGGLALALMFGAVSVSQAQQPSQQRGRQEWAARRGERGFGYLLRGITLTDQQKAELKELRAKRQDQARDHREDFQKLRKEMQEARAKNDTSKVRELRARARSEMQEDREHMVQAIRELLTPDQRAIFDKNLERRKAL